MGGWGGRRNRLTKNAILLLQKYYGKAIRSHVNNVERMKGAVWAVFYHSLSTDDNPHHQFCPTGERSWCKYQCAVAKSEQPPPHSSTLDLAQYIKHTFWFCVAPKMHHSQGLTGHVLKHMFDILG